MRQPCQPNPGLQDAPGLDRDHREFGAHNKYLQFMSANVSNCNGYVTPKGEKARDPWDNLFQYTPRNKIRTLFLTISNKLPNQNTLDCEKIQP